MWAVVLGLGFALAAFGATAAAALVTVSRAELARVLSRRLRGADVGIESLAEVERQLVAASSTTALGVLCIGAALPALVAGLGLLVSVLALVLLAMPFVLVSGYFVPRWLTQPRAAAVRARVLPVLRPWARLLDAVLPVADADGPTGLRAIWREGVGAQVDDRQLATADGVMTFSERPVREVMTPRTALVAIEEDAPLDEIRRTFTESGYSRVPVYRRTVDEIIGMLHAFDLFKLREGDPLPIRPIAETPGNRACGDLLLDMQRERRHLAVVLDEYGGTLGIVTMEDLLEELVGEIFDEHDEGAVPAATAVEGGVLEAEADMPLAAIAARFGVMPVRAEASTVAGFLTERLGRIPAAGERIVVGTLEFDVVQASAQKVERVLVRVGPVVPIVLEAS
jgi:CBS domain containing-hemolysin-like protein